jgi:hypothetical protein
MHVTSAHRTETVVITKPPDERRESSFEMGARRAAVPSRSNEAVEISDRHLDHGPRVLA